MFYDVRRAGGVLVAVATVAALMGGYGLLLRAGLGPAADRLRERDQTFMVATNLEVGARRLLGVLRDRDGDPAGHGEKLGLLIGPSVLHQGVDPALLSSEMGDAYRWANLRIPAHAEDSLAFVEQIYRSGLRPDALILVVNPGIVISDIDTRSEAAWYDPAILLDHLAHRSLELARADLIELSFVPWRLTFPYRGQVFTMVDRALLSAKLAMFATRRPPLSALYAPDPAPYVEPFPSVGSRRDELADQGILDFIGRKGWFEGARYRPGTRNYRLLVDLFRMAHAQGTRCFLVLGPESAALRDRMPAGAADPIRLGFPRDLGPAAPRVFDYRRLLPEGEFADVNHPNQAGRIVETRRLARDLRTALGLDGTPGDSAGATTGARPIRLESRGADIPVARRRTALQGR